MPNLNLVLLMGNLTRDPEVKYTTSGTPIASFGLAVNRTYMVGEEKRQEVTFLDIEFWGKQAEALGKYVHKGDPLHITGRLKLDQWEDKQTGQKRSKIRVIGEQFQFLKNKEGGSHTHDQEADEYTQAAKRHQSQSKPPSQGFEETPEEEDDVPF